jgi:hypothetical protein
MATHVGVSFDPETVVVLRTVLDEAWRTLLVDQQAGTTKSDLAVCVLKLAAQESATPSGCVAARSKVSSAHPH